eukprot:11178627-Lingulodinium_polyedra.AAC.1
MRYSRGPGAWAAFQQAPANGRPGRHPAPARATLWGLSTHIRVAARASANWATRWGETPRSSRTLGWRNNCSNASST